MDKKRLQGLFDPDRSPEKRQQDALTLASHMVMTRIGLEVVKQAGQSAIDFIRINRYNLPNVVSRLKLMVQFAKNNKDVYDKDIVDTHIRKDKVKEDMDSTSMLQGAAFVDVLGIAASLHPDDIDEFCDEIRAVKDRLVAKRMEDNNGD